MRTRKEGLGRIEKLMFDVHAVAEDIGVEVQIQGEKLKRVDENVIDAGANIDLGNDELSIAKERANQ